MFSIVICNYNQEKYLPKCIKSVLNQSCPDWELILVDDGSTDGSLDICRSMANRDRRIKVVAKENGGVHSARIAGLNESSGEYVIFIDSDDWINKDFIKKCNEILQDQEIEIIVFGYYRALDTRGIIKRRRVPSLEGYYSGEMFRRDHFVPSFFQADLTTNYIWNKCYKRELLNRVKLPDVRCIAQDRIENLHLFAAADSFFFSDYCVSFYRYGGVSSGYYPYALRDRKLYYNVATTVASELSLEGWQEPLSKQMAAFFFRHVEFGISFGLSEQEVKTIISEGLQDPVWNEIRERLASAGMTTPFARNDVDGIYEEAQQNIASLYWRNKIKSLVRFLG